MTGPAQLETNREKPCKTKGPAPIHGALLGRPARGRLPVWPLVAALLIGAFVREARADDAPAAEALFVEGRRLLQEKQWDAACPKLAESYKLDPATGTLLALALCYEGQGKTASAWAAYSEAAARARTEKNAEREQAAKERAAALEPKLPHLVLELAPGAPRPAGLTVSRDGSAVGDASLGAPIPVDPGEHDIVARAPGRPPIAQKVRVAEGETRHVVLGPFAPASSAEVPAPPSSPAFFTPLRTVGIAAGAAGVLGLGAGGVLAALAVSKKGESDKDCAGDVCGPVGFPLRKDARSLGDGATVAFLAGGVLAAAGVTLVIVGGPRAETSPPPAGQGTGVASPARPRAAFAPLVGPGAGGLLCQGTF